MPPNFRLLCCPVPGWSTYATKLSSTVLSCTRMNIYATKLSSTVLSCTRMKYTCQQTVSDCAVLYQDEVHMKPNCHLLCRTVPGWSTHAAKLSSSVLSCTRVKYTCRQTVIYCAVLYQDEVRMPPNCHILCSPVPGWSTHAAKLSSTVQYCTRMNYTYHQTVIYCVVLYQDEVHMQTDCHLLCCPVPGWSTHAVKL